MIDLIISDSNIIATREGLVFKWRDHYNRWVQINTPQVLAALMLEIFVGPRPEGHEACHKDDVRSNNHIDNLYWGTHAQNMADAARNGKTYCPTKVVDDEMISRMVELYDSGLSMIEIAKECGIGKTTVQLYVSKNTVTRQGGESQSPKKALSDQEEEQVREAYYSGKLTRREVAEMFGYTDKCVYNATKDIHHSTHMKGRVSK